MNAILSTRRSDLRESVFVFLRWAMGALLIYMGLVKAVQPVEFLKLVREYKVIVDPLVLSAIAGLLPWLEVFLGLTLALGVAVRGSALLLVTMLVPFTFAALQRALAISAANAIPFWAVRFDCGCGLGEVWIVQKLAENTLLIAVSLGLLTGLGRRLSARYDLVKREP